PSSTSAAPASPPATICWRWKLRDCPAPDSIRAPGVNGSATAGGLSRAAPPDHRIGARRLKLLLADFILVIHFAFVLFVVLGLPLIWLGAVAGWQWIRNLRYRVTHLAAILIVS